jgi:TrmH RNA methyltransferase
VAKEREVPILDPRAPPKVPILLVLDGIGNPHNFGAIARSAAFFGIRAMLIGEGTGHAMPSDAAYRTAEGGLELLDLYRVRDLAGTLQALTPHYRTVAATLAADAVPPSALPRDRPTALVLGNEERGVSPEVIAVCRRQVRVPGAHARGWRVQSLNVAQAAAVLFFAFADLAG